jgi:cyclophilin family peptidyl-prolyl cis-trans isomerase
MKNILFKSLCCLGVAMMIFGCQSNKKMKEEAYAAAQEQERQDSIAQAKKAAMLLRQKQALITVSQLPDEPIFDIVTNVGTIKVKLYKNTPKHRENFAKLAISGYYDSLLFHRVINGFMIQGGDPFTKDTSAAMVAKYGQGGPDYTIPAEIVPMYKHKKGALAAARRGDEANPQRESSGSQFYIVQDAKACAQLDGAYTVFGETVDGLPVIDRIAQVPTDKYDRPLDDIRILTIKIDDATKAQLKPIEGMDENAKSSIPDKDTKVTTKGDKQKGKAIDEVKEVFHKNK